jgi:hypothetical protein
MAREYRITPLDMIQCSRNELMMVNLCLEAEAYRLLSVPWTKWVEVTRCPQTGDIVFKYE